MELLHNLFSLLWKAMSFTYWFTNSSANKAATAVDTSDWNAKKSAEKFADDLWSSHTTQADDQFIDDLCLNVEESTEKRDTPSQQAPEVKA